MDHAFNTSVAAEYDVNIAVLLQNFKFWTFNNLANKRNVHDGLCWTYNTLDAFCLTFPYFSKKQIRTALDNAVKEGLIVKGNYNQTKYDRTVWYALSHKVYWYYPELATESFIDLLFGSLDPTNPICPFGHMEKSEWADRFPKKGTPIPDTKPNTKPDINTFADLQSTDSYKDDSLFMRFYSIYPNKQKPEAARKAFAKHKPNEKFVDMLCHDVASRMENNWKNRPKEKIPHPATYLNGKEWEGEIYPSGNVPSNVSSLPKPPRYTMDELSQGIL